VGFGSADADADPHAVEEGDNAGHDAVEADGNPGSQAIGADRYSVGGISGKGRFVNEWGAAGTEGERVSGGAQPGRFKRADRYPGN
jgi:hypothetical protein